MMEVVIAVGGLTECCGGLVYNKLMFEVKVIHNDPFFFSMLVHRNGERHPRKDVLSHYGDAALAI
ncbi:hypothetical protein [Paenibacillus plantarum]|uniref:hypothetical protein n=1 Tax=Paenibacillus plantarum TaxID=2654975 RepID=UPI0014922564|nr:hypothetical protein [Paenibacillus plantarum]